MPWGPPCYLFTLYVTKYIIYSYVQFDPYLQLCKSSTLRLYTYVQLFMQILLLQECLHLV